ncbi:MAG: transposase [Candidatus Gottesmanbacteria bacterium]
MASKNSVKTYIENSFYHIYNRGVEQRKIFQDNQDYSVFLSYLQTYLCPKEESVLQSIIASNDSSIADKDKALKLLRLKNYSEDLDLLCHALLPNHFHLLIKQKGNVLDRFMNSLGTRYGMYFNRKYKRKGVLFQDVYKAVLIESDEQLLHISRYINLNPLQWLNLPISQWENIQFPCSLPEYLTKRQTNWIKPNYILDYFSKTNQNNNYKNFLSLPYDPTPLYKVAIDFEED